MPVIGFLGSSSKVATQQNFGSFSQGMHELGYVRWRPLRSDDADTAPAGAIERLLHQP
jgi:hypothetical protein